MVQQEALQEFVKHLMYHEQGVHSGAEQDSGGRLPLLLQAGVIEPSTVAIGAGDGHRILWEVISCFHAKMNQSKVMSLVWHPHTGRCYRHLEQMWRELPGAREGCPFFLHTSTGMGGGRGRKRWRRKMDW